MKIVVLQNDMNRGDKYLNAFCKGLESLGHSYLKSLWRQSYNPNKLDEYDLVVMWSIEFNDVLEHRKALGLNTLILEYGFFGKRVGEMFFLGLNGLNGRAEKIWLGRETDRWEKWSRHYGVVLKPWRNKPSKYIVIAGQVHSDDAVKNFVGDFKVWSEQTAWDLVGRVSSNVYYKPHPYQKEDQNTSIAVLKAPNHVIFNEATLVTFNSTMGVEAAINGCPVIAMDEGSMIYDYASRYLDEIAHPDKFVRTQWLADLAYNQWHISELESGDAFTSIVKAGRL